MKLIMSSFLRGFNKKSGGFTLAETLIVMGIIGIVAVMTLPTLMTNIACSKYTSQFKKAISTLSQAGLRGQSVFDLDYAAADTLCDVQNAASETPLYKLSFCALFNSVTKARYLGELNPASYVITIPAGAPEVADGATVLDTQLSDYLAYELPEGVMVVFKKEARACTLDKEIMNPNWISRNQNCIGFVDLNGIKTPNKIVNCREYNPTVIDLWTQCIVPTDMNFMTDVYPVLFHDATVEPATPAARSVLMSTKRTMATDTDWIDNH